MGPLLAVAGVLAVLLVAPAGAQESTAMKQVGMVRTGEGTFTMEVEGADIRTVLRAIAEFSGRNIVPGKDVRATVRANVTIDWTLRGNVRAQLRVLVKRILRKHGYPPDKQEKATQTVLEQAEVLSQEWAAA